MPFLPALVLAVWSLSTADARAEALSAVRLRTSSVLLAGQCIGNGPGVGGCPQGEPEWSVALTRGAEGIWSEARTLATRSSGLPVVNHGALWLLARREAQGGSPPFFAFLPLTPEKGITGQRIERSLDATWHAASALDDWTLVLGEQVASRDSVLVHRIEAKGPAVLEMEATEDVLAAWPPPGARLVGSDGGGEHWVALARAPDGALHVAIWGASSAARFLEPLPAVLREAVACTWDGTRALVAIGKPESLRILASDGGPWLPIAERESGPPEGAPLTLLASGEDRRDLLVAWSANEAVHALVLHDGAWGADESLDLTGARPMPSDAPTPQEPLPDSGLAVSPLLAMGAGLVLVLALVTAWVWHRYLRQP